MKILLLDRSGRGHAFADLFARTDQDARIYYAPGCAAIDLPGVVARQDLTLDDPAPLVRFAADESVDLVFVANTVALAHGFVDAFRAAGLPVVGPDRAACRLESSKIYAKELFARYGVPSPSHRAFSDPGAAAAYARQVSHQVVVKADGLCGGNGSFVCDDQAQALEAIDRLMVEGVFGAAGRSVVIEERVVGREMSVFALLDGDSYLMLPVALDYPRSNDGNAGVTSGGMGAICPHPTASNADLTAVERAILHPLLDLIAAERLRYSGVIYLGCLFVEGRGPVLLEINTRMGDPEAEVVLPRLSGDFSALCRAILERRLAGCALPQNDLSYCDVVATQGPTAGHRGWPFGTFGVHHPISGLDAVDSSQCKVFLGEATVLPDVGLVTDGGRAVHVVGFGRTLEQAADHAYANIGLVRFAGIRYRSDIGRVMPWDGA